jgi:hypothetical protein
MRVFSTEVGEWICNYCGTDWVGTQVYIADLDITEEFCEFCSNSARHVELTEFDDCDNIRTHHWKKDGF